MLSRLKKLLGGDSSNTTQTPDPPKSGGDGILVNAYCTCGNVHALNFVHTLHGQRDLSDPELRSHLEGFIGYVLNSGDGAMTRTRYHVMRHVQRVQQHLSVSIDERQLDALTVWASKANAILFFPDGGVCDPQGRVLLTSTGESPDPAAEIPYPHEAWQRKSRIDSSIATHGISVLSSLPPCVAEPELQLRTPQEVIERAYALFLVAVRAESLSSDQPLSIAELQMRLPLAFDFLTPNEQAFMQEAIPDLSMTAQFAWRYECLCVLEWALGLVDDLPFPSSICDVTLVAQTILDADYDQLVRTAKLRSANEILDALDLHYRLHWVVRQAQVDKVDIPGEIDGGVVLERHYALNWLVRFENSEWDEVDTPS